MKCICFSLVLLFSYFSILSSQITGNTRIMDELMDLLDENEDQAERVEEVYTELSELISVQGDINDAGTEILEKLPLLTDFQIHSFLEYKSKYGRIYSSNELSLIPGFHRELISLFTLLFRFDSSSPELADKREFPSPLKQKLLSRIKYEYPQRQGYTEDADSLTGFSGCGTYRLLKYEIQCSSRLKAGITLESDAGEPVVFDSLQNGFNFSSGYINFSGEKWIKEGIIGDYKLSAGEGLLYSRGIMMKTAGNTFVPRLPDMKKYSSTTEYGFFRGAALHLTARQMNAIIHLSDSPLSLTLYPSGDNNSYIKTLSSGSTFRNFKEKKKFHSSGIREGGLILFRSMENLCLGYSLRVIHPDHLLIYNERGDPWTGKDSCSYLLYNSAFYFYRRKKLSLSGEIACKENRAPALIQKISVNLHPLYSLHFGFRYFSPRYFCPGSSGLSESSTIQNERGFFSQAEAFPFSFLKLSLYLDSYMFPWLSSRNTLPLKGHEFRMIAEWYFHRQLDLKMVFKTENKDQRYSTEEPGIPGMEAITTQRFYLQYTWSFTDAWQTRFHIENRSQKGIKDQGVLLYQEINARIRNNSLRLNMRYCLFDIPEWDLRIYSWEHDLLHSFSSPSWYKTGQSCFLNLNLRLGEKLSIGGKIKAIFYTNIRTTGSGADLREAQRFLEFKTQIILKL